MPAALLQPVLAAMIISMFTAPLIIQFAEPIVRKLTANDWLARAAQVTQIAARTMARQDHVIVCGYGRSGQNLARLLETEEIPFVALDADPQRVREAAGGRRQRRLRRREPPRSAGRARACPRRDAVVITFADTPVALQDPAPCPPVAPDAAGHRAHARRFARSISCSTAGATEVVPEVLEGSLMLASHSLLLLGVPLNRVLKRIRVDPRGALRPVPRVLPWGDRCWPTPRITCSRGCTRWSCRTAPTPVGRSLAELELGGLVEVTGVRRRGRALASGRRPSGVSKRGMSWCCWAAPRRLRLAENKLLRRLMLSQIPRN